MPRIRLDVEADRLQDPQPFAGVTQLVEFQLPKLVVAGSSPVARSGSTAVSRTCYNAGMNDARRARAERRRTWVISAHLLDEERAPRIADPSARVAAVWRITLDTWVLSGRSLPEYERAETPVRWCRLGDE